MRMQFAITTTLCFALMTSCLPTLCAGATVYTGDTVGNNDKLNVAANWDDNLPGVNQNVGTININAELSNLNVNTANNVTVNHSAGNIGDLNSDFSWRDAHWRNSGGGTLEWNMTGGSVSDFRVLRAAGASTTANISGGTLTAYTVGGARVQANNGGTVNFTGDAVLDNGYFWADGTGVVNLLGGFGTNMSNGLKSDDAASLINVGGSFTIQSWKSNGAVFRPDLGSYNFDFSGGGWWTGTIADRSSTTIWTDTEWITDLTNAGVTVNGKAVTAGSFSSHFWVDANGALHAVPEPTTLLIWSLLAGLGVGLGWRRRK